MPLPAVMGTQRFLVFSPCPPGLLSAAQKVAGVSQLRSEGRVRRSRCTSYRISNFHTKKRTAGRLRSVFIWAETVFPGKCKGIWDFMLNCKKEGYAANGE